MNLAGEVTELRSSLRNATPGKTTRYDVCRGKGFVAFQPTLRPDPVMVGDDWETFPSELVDWLYRLAEVARDLRRYCGPAEISIYPVTGMVGRGR
jgi:hypothetical protein